MSQDDALANSSALWSSEFGTEVSFQSCTCKGQCGDVVVVVDESSIGSWRTLDAAEVGVARLWMTQKWAPDLAS